MTYIEQEESVENKIKKVLIVDDNTGVHSGISILFSEEIRNKRLEMHSAYNGEEALSKLKETFCDLILLDYQMPVMDGLSFLKIKNMEHIRIPVIMITGNLPESAYKEALEMGVIAFFEKPLWNVQAFRNLVINVIEKGVPLKKLLLNMQPFPLSRCTGLPRYME